MIRKSLLTLSLAIAVILPSVALAEEYGQKSENKPEIRIIERKIATKEAKMNRTIEKKEVRENVKEKIAEKKEENKEKFKEERSEFKEKLATLRDEKKKKLVERVDANLSEINKKRTDKMSDALDRLSEYLTKIKEKATTAESEGADTSAADTAIASAETALASADAAVTAQAGKEYIAQITDETTLSQTVGAAFKSLQADLRATYKTIIEAKKAVVTAAREVAKLREKVEPTEGEEE